MNGGNCQRKVRPERETKKMTFKAIGIVGGVGPYAGLDLNRKVLDHTLAGCDQEHLPVLLATYPALINDRTRYLLERDVDNPAAGLFKVIELLSAAGAIVVGIPCNTAHAPSIFAPLSSMIQEKALPVRLLNMLGEVAAEISSTCGRGAAVGVLSTIGTYDTGLYQEYLSAVGVQLIFPDRALALEVHAAIYDPGFGIKVHSNPVSPQAREKIENAVRTLGRKGAEVVVLGCTELPLAMASDSVENIRLVDPATVLARALIRETWPEKLKRHY